VKQIVEAIKNKRCVIFAGAGLSRNAGLPDWFGLAKELCNKLKEKHYLSEEDISNIEPFLRRKQQIIPMALDLIHAKVGRPIMCETLREILEPKVSSRVHEILKDIQLTPDVNSGHETFFHAANCLA
jgi:NAD-dependent SIR2 family protein deacetylase